MRGVAFPKEQREAILKAIQDFARDEIEMEIGGVDAGFLLDFFTEKIGGYYYNQGLYDAQAVLSKRMDDIGETIIGLEQPDLLHR